MAETAPEVAPSLPSEGAGAANKKRQAKKAAGGTKKSSKPSGSRASELIVKAVSASKERSGVSLATLKKALAAGGYDVEKNNSRLKLSVRALVTKEILIQVKGSGASGSFKLNKKQLVSKKKPVQSKNAAKKVSKSPKKTKKAPNAAKSPKKPAAAAKTAKSPWKKAVKPKAAKSPARKAVKPKVTKSPAKKAAKPKK